MKNIIRGLFFSLFGFLILLPLGVLADEPAQPMEPDPTPPPVSATFHLRYDSALFFEGVWQAPTTTDDVVISDNQGFPHNVSSTSVLAALTALDAQSDAFNITDLAYYDSFGSFLINCLFITEASSTACYNWQYTVNDIYPWVGVDDYILQDGDDVYLYFGSPHQVILSTSTVSANQPFTATAQKYAYQTNEWLPLTPVTIGVTQTNPDNPWAPIEIATSTADELGQATFSLSATGTYAVGIAEDFYYPTVGVEVVEEAAPQQTADAGPAVAVSGGTGGSVPPPELDVTRALQFLFRQQKADGSFGGSVFYSDWTALALAAGTEDEGNRIIRDRLRGYLVANQPGSLLTDFERRAMALMALNVDPYSGSAVDYIQKIVEAYDGRQFGRMELFNDDIFAIITLLNAGYTGDDSMVTSSASFVLSHQQGDGSWGGTDLTAAAVQALSLVGNAPGSAEAMIKARAYLGSQQDDSGGFNNNVYSTAWALQAISALGENAEQWRRSGSSPKNYLATKQGADGGLLEGDSDDNRLWATAYAIPAVLGKTWDALLVNFTKPVSQPPSSATGAGGGVGGNSGVVVAPESGGSLIPPAAGEVGEYAANNLAATSTVTTSTITTSTIITLTIAASTTAAVASSAEAVTRVESPAGAVEAIASGAGAAGEGGRAADTGGLTLTGNRVRIGAEEPRPGVGLGLDRLRGDVINEASAAEDKEGIITAAPEQPGQEEPVAAEEKKRPFFSPGSRTAKTVFVVSASASGFLALYLLWKFLKAVL